MCIRDSSGAADGLDGPGAVGAVDLVAQGFDVGVDHVGAGAGAQVPAVLDEHGAGQHGAGPVHQRLQEGVLLAGQGDLLVAAPHGPGGRVQ